MSIRRRIIIAVIVCAVIAAIVCVASWSYKRPIYDCFAPYYNEVNEKHGDAFRVSDVGLIDEHIDALYLKPRKDISGDEYTELCISFYNDMVAAFGEKSNLTKYHMIVFDNGAHERMAFLKITGDPHVHINYICDFSLFEKVDGLASVCIYALYIDKEKIFALKDEGNEHSFKIFVDMDSYIYY